MITICLETIMKNSMIVFLICSCSAMQTVVHANPLLAVTNKQEHDT